MENHAAFTAASEAVRQRVSRYDERTLLDLYGLYKQATHGDCDTAQPNVFAWAERRKRSAWQRHAGALSREEAMAQYVNLAHTIGALDDDAAAAAEPRPADANEAGDGGEYVPPAVTTKKKRYSNQGRHPPSRDQARLEAPKSLWQKQ